MSLSISLAHKPSPALSLGSSDTLKLTFQIVDEDGKGVQPHQTFLRFHDPITGEEGVQPVKVTSGGKAKFELVRSLNHVPAPPSELVRRRTWRVLRHRCPPPPRTLSRSPYTSAPSCTLLCKSTSSTSFCLPRSHHPSTPTKSSSIPARRSSTHSALSRSSLRRLFRLCSPCSLPRRGLSCSVWYVAALSIFVSVTL